MIASVIGVAAVLLLLAAVSFWLRMVGNPFALDVATGLPLREFPAASPPQKDKPLVIFLTSDVGWLGINTDLPEALAESGYPTVAWNSLRYYLRERTPGEASADLSKLIDHYLAKWDANQFALVGYSWGAGVLPFLANELPQAQKERLSSVSFLAYPGIAAFHFRPSAWLLVVGDDATSATDEVGRLPGVPSVCVAGEGDPIRDCRSLEQFGVERHLLSANHSLTPKLDEVLPHVEGVLTRGSEAMLREAETK